MHTNIQVIFILQNYEQYSGRFIFAVKYSIFVVTDTIRMQQFPGFPMTPPHSLFGIPPSIPTPLHGTHMIPMHGTFSSVHPFSIAEKLAGIATLIRVHNMNMIIMCKA